MFCERAQLQPLSLVRLRDDLDCPCAYKKKRNKRKNRGAAPWPWFIISPKGAFGKKTNWQSFRRLVYCRLGDGCAIQTWGIRSCPNVNPRGAFLLKIKPRPMVFCFIYFIAEIFLIGVVFSCKSLTTEHCAVWAIPSSACDTTRFLGQHYFVRSIE